MKIHTTQNLNSLVQKKDQQTTNSVSKDFRLKNYSEQMLMPRLSAEKVELCSSSVSFGKKMPKNLKDGKKIIKIVNKKVGNIKKETNLEEKKRDKFLTGSFFNKALDVTDYETLATALVAAGACTARAGTIMAIPTKKNKEDNIYASSHALMSGAVGFGTAFILTAPFKAGSNYVMKNMKKNLDAKALKRLYPHLNLDSITNSDGTRKDIKEWLDIRGNKFIEEMKRGEQLPLLRNLADSCEKTFDLLLNKKQVDWASQQGKSFNDVVLKDGSKLYDSIDMSRLGITISEEGMGNTQFMLQDLDKSFFEKVINDAKGTDSNWAKIDVNSMFKELPMQKGATEKEYEVVDFRQWKDINGNQWKLNLDEVCVSSPYETNYYKPRYSGKKRYDTKDLEYKYVSYQENGKDGKLGTPISAKMAEADRANEGLTKTLTWAPDLLFRVPVAALTIALIPWALKNIFHIEKSSSKKKAKQAKEIKSEPIKTDNVEDKKAINFKGKGDKPSSSIIKKNWDKLMEKIGKFLGELYGKPLIESERLHKASSWMSRLPGNVTQHMTAFGSLITSGVYMQQTVTNKDLDPDRRRTLAINQGLCFAVPTLMAYIVDKRINKWVKKNEYRYSDLTQHKLSMDKLNGVDKEIVDNEMKTLSKKLKGFRTLASITVFALIYRYFTPVIMTPIANVFGDKLNAKKAAKRVMLEQQLNTETQNVAKEIDINSNREKMESKQVA